MTGAELYHAWAIDFYVQVPHWQKRVFWRFVFGAAQLAIPLFAVISRACSDTARKKERKKERKKACDRE